METLPLELWLIILDMVVEEGIIWLDHCDHMSFPYIHARLPSSSYRYLFYGSYCQLRLVCRTFKMLLGPSPPHSLMDSSLFTMPSSTRALYVNLSATYTTCFQRLLAEPLRFQRLVYLDITCSRSEVSSRNVFDILCTSDGRSFRNVQRLTLRLAFGPWNRREKEKMFFWMLLQRAFPLLVTLVLSLGHLCKYGWSFLPGETDEAATFDRLEILHLSGGIPYNGCIFPRLRHASVEGFSLEILQLSPHLESLLIRHCWGPGIDIRSFSHLRLLGVRKERKERVVLLEYDHPLEHLWLFVTDTPGDYFSINDLLKKLPGVSRFTLDLSSAPRVQRTPVIEKLAASVNSIGLTMTLPTHALPYIVLHRAPADTPVEVALDTTSLAGKVTRGHLGKVRRRLRR